MMIGLSLGLCSTAGMGGAIVSAFAPARRALEANTGNVDILVIGDSVNNDTNEWVYLASAWLGTKYPAYTVSYRRFNDGTNVYDAATVISSGSGPNTLRIWNASVPGANLYSLRGNKLDPIAIAPFGGGHPAVVILSLGENSTGFNSIPSAQRGQMIAMIEDILLPHPGVPVAALLQNPWRDEDTLDPVIASWRAVKALRPELTLVDVYSRFIAAGKNPALYIDSIHPSEAGTALYLLEFQMEWERGAILPASGAFIAWLTNRAANDILYNGDFAAFSGATPDSFSMVGAGAVLTKDTTIKAPGKAYSAKLVNGTASANIRQILDASQLALVKGKKVTLAVHIYIDAAAAAGTDVDTARSRVFTNGTGSGGAVHSAGNAGQGGWRWDVISGVDIPSDATLLWAMLYANSAAGTTKGTIYIDEIRLFVGEKCGA